MPVSTPNFGLLQPLVNSATDGDLWGGYLNTTIGDVDTLMLSALNFVTSVQTATPLTVAAPTAGSSTTGSAKALFLCNATSNAITANLPSASSAGNGFTVAFKKTDNSANVVTITPNNTDTIDGVAILVMSTSKAWAILVSDGVSNWSVISESQTSIPHGLLLNVQVFNSSGTYTPTSGTNSAMIYGIGGGGGGSSSSNGSNNATAGGTTSVGSLLSCGGGNPGVPNGVAPSGGTVSTATIKLQGSTGGSGNVSSSGASATGSTGAPGLYGSGGGSGGLSANGGNAAVNSGAGGGAGGGSSGGPINTGSSGAGGGIGITYATGISGTYSVAIGSGGTGGTGGNFSGGAGGSGLVIIYEYS